MSTTLSPASPETRRAPQVGLTPQRLAARIWLITCLLGAVVTASWGYLSASTATKETRIDQMTVGRWVLSDNPIEADDTQFGREVDSATWRMIHLEAPKTDGSSSDVYLLRPVSWLKDQWASHHAPRWMSLIPATDPTTGEEGYQLASREDLKSNDGQRLPGPVAWIPPYDEQQLVDQQMHIQVPECGISGWARVLSIGSCPQISPRPGPRFQVVTGTFKHHSKKVIDVRIDGLAAPIGATPNHPFWSEDKQDFVRADQLQPGERLRQANGSLPHVVSLTPRPGEHDVYNIEVQIDHAYHVGASGVLVHNPGVLPGFVCPPDAAFGYGEHLGQFRQQIAAETGRAVEESPFLSLTKPTDNLQSGMPRAMQSSRHNHFNMQGITAPRYNNWLSSTSNPSVVPGYLNITHWELWQIKQNGLMWKTTFYGAPGDNFIPWVY